VATPAGLLDVQAGTSKPDLLLTVTEESPLALVQSVLARRQARRFASKGMCNWPPM
jgi:hypothetical protein